MEDEEGDQLLLARTRKARDRSAVEPDVEPAKQIDPERGCASHTQRLHVNAGSPECPETAVVRLRPYSQSVTVHAFVESGFSRTLHG